MTSIIVGSQEYSLKYDVKQNKLRDLTWDELKILYGNVNSGLLTKDNFLSLGHG